MVSESEKAFYAGKLTARVGALEDRMSSMERSLTWMNRMVLAVLVGVVITGIRVFLNG